MKGTLVFLLLVVMFTSTWAFAKDDKEYLTPVWNQRLSAVDGDPLTGCDSSRFECVMDGEAVLDLETGLVWQRHPDAVLRIWADANDYCANLTLGGRKGWRLADYYELSSLVDPDQRSPALPIGHPFKNIHHYLHASYWGKANIADYNLEYIVQIDSGSIGNYLDCDEAYTICVRSSE